MIYTFLFLSASFLVVEGYCTKDCGTDPTAQQFCYKMGTSVYPADAFNKCDPFGCQMVSINNKSDYDSFMAYRSCFAIDTVWLPYKYNSTTGQWLHYLTGQQIGYIAWSTGNPDAGSAADYMETWSGALDDIDAYGQYWAMANWMCMCYMCGPFPDPNLVVSRQWTPPLTNVTFSCAAGYTLNGMTTLTCLAGGKWNNSTAQICVATTTTSTTSTSTTSTTRTTSTTSTTPTTSTTSITTTTSTTSTTPTTSTTSTTPTTSTTSTTPTTSKTSTTPTTSTTSTTPTTSTTSTTPTTSTTSTIPTTSTTSTIPTTSTTSTSLVTSTTFTTPTMTTTSTIPTTTATVATTTDPSIVNNTTSTLNAEPMSSTQVTDNTYSSTKLTKIRNGLLWWPLVVLVFLSSAVALTSCVFCSLIYTRKRANGKDTIRTK